MSIVGAVVVAAALALPGVGSVQQATDGAATEQPPGSVGCVSSWDLIDPTMSGSSLSGAHIGRGLLGECELRRPSICETDPVGYQAAVLFVAGHVGVYVEVPTCGGAPVS